MRDDSACVYEPICRQLANGEGFCPGGSGLFFEDGLAGVDLVGRRAVETAGVFNGIIAARALDGMHVEQGRAVQLGQLALDTRIESKHKLQAHALHLVYPGDGPFEIVLLTASPDPFSMSATTWHELPGVLTAPFMGNWPDNARPFQYGPRAQKIQKIVLGLPTP